MVVDSVVGWTAKTPAIWGRSREVAAPVLVFVLASEVLPLYPDSAAATIGLGGSGSCHYDVGGFHCLVGLAGEAP